MGRTKGSTNVKANEIKSDEVRERVSTMSIEGVTNKIAAAKVEVQHTLEKLSTTVTDHMSMLTVVDQAIILKKDELQKLRDIEVTATTLDDLNLQIEATRAKWEEEKALAAKEAERATRELTMARAREEEVYQYNKTLERRKADDAYNANSEARAKADRERAEALTKAWNERENAIKAKELEFNDYRNQVTAFPDVLKSKIAEATTALQNSLTSQFETKVRIANAENATEKKLAAQEIASLNTTIINLNLQIESLKKQLAAAHEDVKNVSTKAMESASGREAYASLQRALETMQNSKSSK
jgi:uncharacterized coiled-coil protein SlyX